jgi:small subunit ribosomal protein S11
MTKDKVESQNNEVKNEEKWGILYIYSSYNNTHLHVTDITGSETIAKVTGGMVTKSDRLKASPNVAMAAAKQLSEAVKAKGINALYVKLRAVGGHNGPMTPGPGSQAAIRMLNRYGIKLGRIEDVTPVPHDSCRKKGGKRGRRV